MNSKNLINTLNELIEICKDGDYGFDQSAKYSVSPKLQNLFKSRSEMCHGAARELNELVAQYSGAAETGGTVVGVLHRGWVSVRVAVTKNEDMIILEECEKVEDRARARYETALTKQLPPAVRTVIERQYEGVLHNHEQIKALRGQFEMESQRQKDMP